MDIKNFYEKNFTRQVRQLTRILKFGKDQAEDIVQSAYVKAMENIDQYDENKGTLNAWFNKIMFNQLHKFQRQPVDFQLNDNVEDEEHTPYEFRILEKEIPKVSNDLHRKILSLFYLQGYTGKEISELTSVSVSNITTICNRFKKTLEEEYSVKL